ncbi:MAG: BCAM0308 family protein [Gammaproteobacteria bacterium]
MAGRSKRGDFLRRGRRDRLLRELEHDPYKSKEKLPEPTQCPECRAFFHRGRWQWGEAPADAHQRLCPACQRTRDHVPAGLVTLSGAFFQEHREEIMQLVRNVEEKEKAEHPLDRIMEIEDRDDGVAMAFTDAHLARGVGEAVRHAYQGELELQYGQEDVLLRATWRR